MVNKPTDSGFVPFVCQQKQALPVIDCFVEVAVGEVGDCERIKLHHNANKKTTSSGG